MSENQYDGVEFSTVNRDAPGYRAMVERLEREGDPLYAEPLPHGEFSIGGELWPGLSKLLEECGEVGQVGGKIIGAEGRETHWDGSHLPTRLIEEIGDVLAASRFVARHNNLDWGAIRRRADEKEALFEQWHAERLAGRNPQ